MKIAMRVLSFLLVLCLLGGLVGMLALFVPIPWLSGLVNAQSSWLPIAFSIILLFFIAACVLALVLIVSVPSKRKVFVLNKDAGKIEITRQSIESEANGALASMHEVLRYHVQAKGDLRPGKVKLDVQAQPRDPNTNLDELGQAIQQRLASVMAKSLAIEPRHIQVHIHAIRPSEEKPRRHDRVPRVV